MRSLMMAVVLGVLPAAGGACTYLAPFAMESLPLAELVVVGKVTGYQPLDAPWGAALVTVAVEQALKGDVEAEVTFIWNSGMAQGPHESRTKGLVMIGAMKGGRVAVSAMMPDARPDLPSVVQPYCGDVWIQPATAARVAEAKEALK